jgi:hypothetical protein
MRLCEERDYGFVNAFASGGFNDLSKNRMASGEIMFEPQHCAGDGTRVSASKTHHANAAASGRRGNGDDRIVQIHGLLMLVC